MVMYISSKIKAYWFDGFAFYIYSGFKFTAFRYLCTEYDTIASRVSVIGAWDYLVKFYETVMSGL